tara:strand:- start:471 stop:1061 length:591 start_codon:yes stop_codon:yes gene_type:complete
VVDFADDTKLNASAAQDRLSVQGLGSGVVRFGSIAAFWSTVQNMMEPLTDKDTVFVAPLCRGILRTFKKCGCKIYGWGQKKFIQNLKESIGEAEKEPVGESSRKSEDDQEDEREKDEESNEEIERNEEENMQQEKEASEKKTNEKRDRNEEESVSQGNTGEKEDGGSESVERKKRKNSDKGEPDNSRKRRRTRRYK